MKLKKEYLKDNTESNNPEFEFGNDFYHRNTSQNTKTYKISSNATISLCGYTLNHDASADLVQVSMDILKNHINKYKTNDSGVLLFKIKLSNDIVSDISMIYIP